MQRCSLELSLADDLAGGLENLGTLSDKNVPVNLEKVLLHLPSS
jgi:hypothetical protein